MNDLNKRQLADRAAALALRRQKDQEREQAKRERIEALRGRIEWLGVLDEELGLSTAIYTSTVYGRVRLIYKIERTMSGWSNDYEKIVEYVVDITAFYTEGDYSQRRSSTATAPSVEEAVTRYVATWLR